MPSRQRAAQMPDRQAKPRVSGATAGLIALTNEFDKYAVDDSGNIYIWKESKGNEAEREVGEYGT